MAICFDWLDLLIGRWRRCIFMGNIFDTCMQKKKHHGVMWQIFYCNSYMLSILSEQCTLFFCTRNCLPRVLCVACCWMDMNKEEAESWAGGFFLSSQLPRLEWRRQTTLGEVRSSDTDLTLQWSPTIDTPTAGGGIFTRWDDGGVHQMASEQKLFASYYKNPRQIRGH